MAIVYFLAPIAIIFSCGFALAFLWAVKNDQFEDLETPAHRILMEDNINESIK